MTSHYRTLGVDPDADPVAIRSAYLALMRRYHPDRGGEEADPVRAQALTAAWEVLRDPERREAYDQSRKARFHPGEAVVPTAAARGGAAGRNLFLLLTAATIGLGWWASQQPQPRLPVRAVVSAKHEAAPPVEPPVRPEVRDQTPTLRMAEEKSPVAEPVPDDTIADPVELPVPAPVVMRPPALPRTTEVNAPSRRQAATKPEVADPAATIDLVSLERHLQLLTDQSMRFGTEAKRARLVATGDTFAERFSRCDDDACRRDAYLRRNAEVGEIMRNR